MNIADFRKQSSTPTLPSSSNVVGLYVNSNSVFNSINSAGVITSIAGTYTGSYSTGFVSTGLAPTQTGIIIGKTGAFNQFILGTPDLFLPVTVGSDSYLIPAFGYKKT